MTTISTSQVDKAESGDPDFRENPKRCIHVFGEIDYELSQRLAPRILELRHESSAPITVYIDSNGGQPVASDQIINLLRAPTPGGNVLRIITVAVGRAESAAADLLAAGDYAVAYPNATVLCHGTRTSLSAVTTEAAADWASFLRSRNETAAARLADQAIRRLMFIYMSHRREFPAIRKELGREAPDIQCFENFLKEKVLTEVVENAFQRFQRLTQMKQRIDEIMASSPPASDSTPAQLEVHLLLAILRHQLESNPQVSLSGGGLQEIQDDFSLLKKMDHQRHGMVVTRLARRWGRYFLTPEETAQLQALREQPEKKAEALDYLVEKSRPSIQPVWFFCFGLCQLLQTGENRLDAEDAYWTGLVDEVLGADLPCLRTIIEEREDAASEQAAQPSV